MLHPVQKKLLEILEKNVDNPLTVREIQDSLDISSTSVVAHHLTQLEKKGYLRKNPYNSKDYQILKKPDEQITYANLYGLATCGPSGSLLDGDPIDRIPISTRILSFPAKDLFMVKANGDSMEPKISNGDLVIVKKCNDADSGDVVVCVNDEKAMIKKIEKQNNGQNNGQNKNSVILISLNSEKYKPFIADKDFRIEGVVKGVISSKF
jgi:repressor LexA